ncbi:DUF2254 domain-containing protein [Streptomyces macrosporus]|uniref:DUF2254 domain-containing protein n=1 Tax=Streptomyces macrosporus TaxID=44032 RepID=A0ABN3JWG6_9ACTN
MKPFRPPGTPHAEKARTPLWTWPAAGGLCAFAVALVLGRIRPERGTPLSGLWPGDNDSASTALQALATGAVTVTTVTFSITVVTLQLASQQFSPRLLRRYARDRTIKTVLTVLISTAVFTLTALAFLDAKRPVPAVALFVAATLGIASLAAVLGFLTHIVREVRVDSMMLSVHDETDEAIRMFYPARTDPPRRSPGEPPDRVPGTTVHGRSSGFVRSVRVEELVEGARRAGAVVWLLVRPGDLVVSGNPIAVVWARDPSTGASAPYPDEAGAADLVEGLLVLGYERTLEQDVAFGFRQLEDIAVKAVSPGINDPQTACTAVGHMADLLVRVAGSRLGATVHEDRDGVGRAVVPDRDLRYYLDLACGQLRRYASAEPTVLGALLRMLRDLAVAVRAEEDVAEVRRAADLVRDTVAPSVRPEDAEQVHDLHRRVVAALEGRTVEAYLDRSGETRSV